MSDKKLLNETTIRRFWKLANLQPLAESDLTYLQEEEEELDEVAGGKDKEDKDKMEEVRTDDDKEKVDEVKPPQGSGIKGVYDMSDHGKGKKPKPGVPKKVGTKGSTVQDVNEDAEEVEEARYKRDDEEVEEARYKRDDEEANEGMGAMQMKRDDEESMEEMDEPGMEGPEEDIDAEVTVPESDVEALRKARDVIDQILSAADDGEPEMDMDDDGDDDIDLSDEEDDDPMMEEEDLDEDMLEEMISTITNRVSQRLVKEALIRKLTK